LFESLAFLLKLNEELLGVAASLGARASADMNLNAFPLLSEELECLNEAEVFVHSPSASLLTV
jgi:hypothetical protein